MLVRGLARRWSPSVFGVVAAGLALAGYSSGAPVVFLLILFPATVGGLILYLGCGWRRALWTAAATLVVLFILGAIDTALGPGLSGGGMAPSAGAR